MNEQIIKAIKNDPNISNEFSKHFCYCGGNMISTYDQINKEIAQTCMVCGKQKKLYANLEGEKWY